MDFKIKGLQVMPQKINNIISQLKTESEESIAQALDKIELLSELTSKEKLALSSSLTQLFYRDQGGMAEMISLANRAEKQITRFGADVIPFLLDELINADAESCVHLGRTIALNGANAIAPLLTAWETNRDDKYALINLTQALAYFRVPEVLQAFPKLLLAANSENHQLRSNGLDAIGKLAVRIDASLFDEPLRLEMFSTAFSRLSDSRSLVRMHAARALGKMLEGKCLCEGQQDKLRKAYNVILGKDGDYAWDDAYIVRHEAKHYRHLLKKATTSVARYQQSFKILAKEKLCSDTFHYVIEAPLIARKLQAGQFIIVRPHKNSERIPLSICGWDRDKGHINVVIMSAGRTTIDINEMKVGDTFSDIVGPLGERSHVRRYRGTCVVIGGGFGTGAIIPTARDLKALGSRVIGVIGARTKNLLIMVEELKESCDEVIITTNDGSDGIKGFVTTALEEIISKERRVSHVLAIGPVPMMQAVCELTRPIGIETMVSLNAIMVDGTGMCGACRVSIDGETKFACFHGPDFDGHKVDFDQLTKRQKMFVTEEKIALGN
ncbi:NADH-dependent reduced ferredoxin:NADP+ oxidoreductase subunit A [hydrothermal vent metagenome]|uniref:NADH-dependent reduced ferredoxin:NADP+ oxidoreductase subunit A n=1 Tax=hydrothermal vent metagenome TaxID=652676 RepID=A0A3B1B9N2_9ZZZZ